MRQIDGLANVIGSDAERHFSQATSVFYGPLRVTRWFPAWWGISPWQPPFWEVEVKAVRFPESDREG